MNMKLKPLEILGEINLIPSNGWCSCDIFCKYTTYTKVEVELKRKRKEWPDGLITKIENKQLRVNVWELQRRNYNLDQKK